MSGLWWIALHTFIYLQMPLVTIFKVPFSINILAQSPCIKVQINLVGNLEEMSMEFAKEKDLQGEKAHRADYIGWN